MLRGVRLNGNGEGVLTVAVGGTIFDSVGELMVVFVWIGWKSLKTKGEEQTLCFFGSRSWLGVVVSERSLKIVLGVTRVGNALEDELDVIVLEVTLEVGLEVAVFEVLEIWLRSLLLWLALLNGFMMEPSYTIFDLK